MDGTGFDGLARRLNVIRLDRAAALRGIGGVALAALIAVAPGADGVGANGKKKPKKKPVCVCATEDPAGCRTIEVSATKAKQKAAAKCNYKGRCQRGVVAARCRCGGGAPCRVFLTSTTHNGNFGGLAGADAICQGLAETANLPGTYKVWLSDSTASPSTRFVHSPGPYVLVDGTTVAEDWTDLTDRSLAAPIDVTETGSTVTGDERVWTGTQPDGQLSASSPRCENWSTNAVDKYGLCGGSDRTDYLWTELANHQCSSTKHFYCFQQS